MRPVPARPLNVGPLGIQTKRRILITIVAAYLVTWVGGWIAHVREMENLARQKYSRAEVHNAEAIEAERLNPIVDRAYPIELRREGPASDVNWCLPLLPGLLLADSAYFVGPMYAKGTTKIVVYYGVGSFTALELWGWIT